MKNIEENSFILKTKKYNKTLYIIFITLISLLIITTYIDLKSKYNHMQDELKNIQEIVIDEYKDRLKESLSSTIGYIDELYYHLLDEQKMNNIVSNKLTPQNYQEFENKVRMYLYKSIFEEVRYTWINKVVDFNGGKNYAIRLIHPNLKHKEGEYLNELSEDLKGNKPYKMELDGIKNSGEAFYTYYFKQYGKDDIVKKIDLSTLYRT